MANKTIFETLIELAVKDADEAAKCLGKAVQASSQSKEKLELLLEYRQDYLRELGEKLASGLSVLIHKNYQEFVAGLDRAISQQREICNQCEQVAAKALDESISCERKRLSYETLDERKSRAQQVKDNQREQKLSDEFAMRLRRNMH
jgi:flagellar FliJ protein